MPATLAEKSIFNVARKIDSPDARASYIQQVTGNDRDLAERVRLLLQAMDQPQGLLKQPPAQDDDTANLMSPLEPSGTRIGPYKLREPIGEGGMGIVYVAEQERPVRRKVALKLIKPGRDTKEVIARFETERRALAMMDHPNIARVLDAGTTPAGRPYFVMELVRGISITDYCDKAKLTTDQRLRLFITVCQAVQHAHQKGIIHRDIKPSNVLITQHDDTAVVKVIDFGLAKALNESLSDTSVYTAFHQLLGTPKFMSPEQAEMSGLDVDTRSDIYSLGVLLYVLLTGKTPLDSDQRDSPGLDEMRRRIRDVTPAKPSARFSTMSNIELTTVAQQRRVEPSKLTRQLRGDLDRIVMKALEKDRTLRYETSNALAEDVKRYLNNEPVKAVAPSLFYLFRKTLRRHKVALATAASFLTLLLTGTVTSGLLAVRAHRAAASSSQQAQAANSALVAAANATRQANIDRDLANGALVQAKTDRDRALTQAYINDIRSSYLNARHADGNEQVRFDLAKWMPSEGDVDRRGWEWYLLNSIQFGAERLLHGHVTTVQDIAPSPDGKQLISIDSEGMLVLWEATTGAKLASVQADDVAGTAVAWSPLGDRFATAGADGTIKLWQVGRWDEPRVLQQHTNRVNGMAFSPSGDRLASASDDHTAIIWNLKTGESATRFEGHSAAVNSVNWHPDGQQIVSTSENDKSVRFWDPVTSEELAPAMEQHPARWAIWRPDGATACHRGVWLLAGTFLDLRWQHARADSSPHGAGPGASRVESGRHGAGDVALLSEYDGPDLGSPGGAHEPSLPRPHLRHPANLLAGPGSRRLLQCRSHDSDLELESTGIPDRCCGRGGANRRRMEPKRSMACLAHSVRPRRANLIQPDRIGGPPNRRRWQADPPLAWAPDSNRLATWDFDNVVIWNVQNGASLMRFPTTPTPNEDSTEHSMGWDPTRNRLFTAASRNIAIWEPLTGQRLHLVEDVPTVAQWSPDGTRLVTKNQWSGTFLVDLSNPQKPVKRKLPFAEIAAWSPDGSRFATGDWNGLVRVRDAQSGMELLHIPGHAQTGLTSLSWHPDGSRIASASVLGTIKIWDAQTGEEMLTLREHAGPVHAVRFDRDGMALASVGEDGRLNVWDASTGYARGQSKQLIALLEEENRAQTANAQELQVRGRIHSAAGNWEQAAADFERAAKMLGSAAPSGSTRQNG